MRQVTDRLMRYAARGTRQAGGGHPPWWLMRLCAWLMSMGMVALAEQLMQLWGQR